MLEAAVAIVAIISGVALTVVACGAVPFAMNVTRELSSIKSSQIHTAEAAGKLAGIVDKLNELLHDHEKRITMLELE